MIFHINEQTSCLCSSLNIWLAAWFHDWQHELGILCLEGSVMTLGWGCEKWPCPSFTKRSLKNICIPGSATTMAKMNELSAHMKPPGATRNQVNRFINSMYPVNVGVKSNTVGQTPAIDSVANTSTLLQSLSGWTELMCEVQRRSQGSLHGWDYWNGHSQAMQGLEGNGGRTSDFIQNAVEGHRGLHRGMTAF